MTDPKLVHRNALVGVKVAISVSDSEDLARLGLSPRHCEMAVAELARAIMIAGGTVVYGGRLVPAGFTDILLDEVRRFREDREALIICLAETEHRKLSTDELSQRERQMSTAAEIVCLSTKGEPVDIASRAATYTPADPVIALTAMRRYVTAITDARVLIGGRLRGYQGAMPGLIEEALMSVARPQPLYVAGGFGGASCAIADVLERADFGWLPADCPSGAADMREMLMTLAAADQDSAASDGLSPEERRQLAVTHRPADIAALVVLGLSQR